MRQGDYVEEQIRLYMDAQGLSQAELARRLDVSPQSIDQVLSGQKNVIALPLETIRGTRPRACRAAQGAP
jgi:transcriptional regulator with XRE-family HTH domain